ncbi:MAG: RluA family pseudouridine synthase [Anaerorhabdus sp.]
MISILYEDNHLLIVQKPVNIPVQEDSSKDPDLLSLLKEDLKKRYDKPGNVYLGLVHRLDRPVGGVMVFAKTSKAASRLAEQVRTHQIKKIYHAIIQGRVAQRDSWDDYLIKDEKKNRVSVTSAQNSKAKKATLHYHTIAKKEDLSLVEIQLETGRPHQIRVQFSSRNAPLWGDQRYNLNATVGQQIALWAVQLELQHPITKEKLTFTSQPPNQYPWSLLKGETYA